MKCETCNDTRKVYSEAWEAPPAPCPDCRAHDIEATLRAEVARLEKELDAEQTRHRSTKLSLSDERTSRQYWEREANTDHRGEAQEAKRNEAHAMDMERRVTKALKQVEAENTRLSAEVERLEGRDTSRPLAVGDVITIDGEVGMVAWVGSERCRVVWSTEEVTFESKDTTITARAAWLAGCKP